MTAPAITLVVPMPPTLTNSGRGRSRHWRAVHAEKLAYWEALETIAVFSERGKAFTLWRLPRKPPTPLHRVLLTSEMVLRGGMDDDNAIARHKPLTDFLVTRGYLATDRRERKRDGASCRWAAFPEQRVTRAADDPPRITLTITPCEGR